jgi:hypothetical protein
MNGAVNALAVGSDGTLYAGGDFTSAGNCTSAAGCNSIARWNGASWSALSAGMNGAVRALAVGSDGTLYAGGDFSSAGSCLSDDGCNSIARWNGTSWSALDTGMNSTVYTLAVGSDGALYAGGDFTSAGSCTSAAGCNRIARWDGTSWSALGTGMNSTVYTLARGSLWVGGSFNTVGDKVSSYIAQWTPSVPTAVTLASFTAVGGEDAVTLQWETASELDNLGFHVLRGATPEAAQVTRLTEALIPSQAPGSGEGFAYEWSDSDVVAGTTYYYWLEAVDTQGGSALHGPVSATMQAPTAVTLSRLGANHPAGVPLAAVAAGALASLGCSLGVVARRRRG